MPRYAKTLTLPLICLLSLACSLFGLPSTAVPETPTAAVDDSTTTAGAPEATHTAAPSPTAPPSPSPAPLAATDTPASAGLNPHGPYVLFQAQSGVWIANPDGSFPTQLTSLPGSGDLRAALSPAGDRLALVLQTETGLDLVLVSLPGGATETIARLSPLSPVEAEQDVTSAAAFALYAIRDYNSVAWQPGAGRLLAFVAAINGPTADVYVYDTQAKAITQLTDGPSQAVLPTWSPDGQYLLHAGVSWVPPFGGAIGGANQLDGVWAVRVADGALVEQPKPAGALPHFVGWVDDGHYLTYDSDETCFSTNLRSVAVASGQAAPVMDYSFSYYLARSPENGALLFASAAGCANSLGDGAFLLVPGQPLPVQLLTNRVYGVDWLPESQVFQAYPELDFIHSRNMKEQGKLRQFSAKRIADADPAQDA